MSYNLVMGKFGLDAFNRLVLAATREWTEDRYYNMTQDLNGNELAIGDRILVCVEKDYGWLGYATIIGESKLTWRIKLEDSTNYNQTRNFDKNSKRILKA